MKIIWSHRSRDPRTETPGPKKLLDALAGLKESLHNTKPKSLSSISLKRGHMATKQPQPQNPLPAHRTKHTEKLFALQQLREHLASKGQEGSTCH